MLGGDVERWLCETTSDKTKAVAAKFENAGFKVRPSPTQFEGASFRVPVGCF